MSAAAAEEKKEKMFLKASLGSGIFLASSDLVIKIEKGKQVSNDSGEVVVGVSFGDVNESRIEKKLKALKKGEKEIETEVKSQRNNLLKAYKAEIITKLTELKVDQEAVKAVGAELDIKDLAYLLG